MELYFIEFNKNNARKNRYISRILFVQISNMDTISYFQNVCMQLMYELCM